MKNMKTGANKKMNKAVVVAGALSLLITPNSAFATGLLENESITAAVTQTAAQTLENSISQEASLVTEQEPAVAPKIETPVSEQESVATPELETPVTGEEPVVTPEPETPVTGEEPVVTPEPETPVTGEEPVVTPELETLATGQESVVTPEPEAPAVVTPVPVVLPSAQPGVASMNVQAAWLEGYTGKGIKIAVIDSGINAHTELKIAGAVSFLVDDPSTPVDESTIYDNNGHGTHVAGIIGSAQGGGTINGADVVGVAPDAELYSLKVKDGDIGSQYDVINAIRWSIQNQMNIINMSISVPSHYEELHQAIKDATAAGIVIITASGNGGKTGQTVTYPAIYEEVIAVGSVDANGNISDFTSFGPGLEVDFVAIGEGVISTNNKGGYEIREGTSQAAPHVAGFVALLMQKNPNMSPEEIKNELLKYAVDKGAAGKDSIYGNGMLDYLAYTGGEVAPTPEPEVPVVTPEPTPEPEVPVVTPEPTPEPEVPVVTPEPTPEPEVPVVTPEPTPEPQEPVVTPEPNPEPQEPVVTPEPTPEPQEPVVTPEPTPEPQEPVVTPEPTPEPQEPVVTPEPTPEPQEPVVTPEPTPEPQEPVVTPEPTPEPQEPVVTPEPTPEPQKPVVEPTPVVETEKGFFESVKETITSILNKIANSFGGGNNGGKNNSAAELPLEEFGLIYQFQADLTSAQKAQLDKFKLALGLKEITFEQLAYLKDLGANKNIDLTLEVAIDPSSFDGNDVFILHNGKIVEDFEMFVSPDGKTLTFKTPQNFVAGDYSLFIDNKGLTTKDGAQVANPIVVQFNLK